MSEAFDPYRQWLGVPSGPRPPNHYALLGLSLFEQDAEAISNAADRQMAYVRTHQTGPHAAITQQLLNELAAARLCLLSPAKKSQYDAELRAKQPVATPPPSAPARADERIAPQPLAPQPVLLARPSSAAQPTTLRTLTPRQPASNVPGWLAPAGAGILAGVLLAAIAMSLGGADRSPSLSPSSEPAPNKNTAAKAAAGNALPAKSKPNENQPEKPDDASAGNPAAASIFQSLKRPSLPGVTSAKLVITNQHNAGYRDRGALECNVRLLAGGREVWSQENLPLPWSPDEDLSRTMILPSVRFERVRIEITKWEQSGGGLSEIEVLSAEGRNLAYGQPAVASGIFGARFAAGRVVDGVNASADAESGYWLLPDNSTGWIEVDLSLPRPAKLAGVKGDKLVIWNQHNGPHNNSGTQSCDVTLYSGDRVASKQDRIELTWAPGADLSVARELPRVPFDRLRVEVAAREGQHAGLAELQILEAGKNLALDCPTLGSGCFDQRRCEVRVTDGIVSSAAENIGYWIVPLPQTPGWVEIDLACLDPEYGAACRQLGLSLALVDGDWRRGLLWLARGDDRSLRRLAQIDRQEMYDVPEQLAAAEAWRELAQQAEGKIRQRLLARAMWRYRRVLSRLHEFAKPQVQAVLDETLPELPERNYLFFMSESELKVAEPLIRERPVVVRGEPSPYGLFLHPNTNDSSHAAFRLGKRYRRFHGAAAISDSAWNRTATALVFRVVGDGRELWKSPPMKESGSSQAFDLDIAGVDKLELFADCPGDYGHAHAAWVEPQLE